jgi:hypothetical protein
MKKILFAAVSAFSLVIAPTVAFAKDDKPAELSASELATLQSRNIGAPYDVLFPSVMSTLQQLNYVNINASRDAGTASAQTEAKGKIYYNIIWGFGKKKRTQLASLFMEPAGAGASKLSLKLSTVEAKSRGFGGSFSEGTPVAVADPYREFYAALDAEIARRGAVAPK